MAFDPDQYLAEKTSGSFDPDAYLAAKEEDPGMLKSAAAGLMSGIPLAKSAIAGVKSAIGDKSFQEEKDELSNLEDKAWDKHGTAYGLGKGAGIVGSSVIAPESIPARIALAAGMGAGAGIDASKSTADLPMDALKGATIGTALGTVGEGLGQLATKVLPKAAKGVVSSLAGGPKNVETYLKNPEGVNNAIGKTAAAEKLADRVNDLNTASGHLSDDAVAKLNPEVAPITTPALPKEAAPASVINTGSVAEEGYRNPATGLMETAPGNSGKTVVTHGHGDPIFGVSGQSAEDTLTPLFAPTEQALTVNGVAVGQAQRNALNALQGYKDSLRQIAEKNGGQIPETALGKIVRDMQHDVNWNVDDAVVNSAKKQLEGTINDLLKKSNPGYGTAMESVSEPLGLASNVKKTFKLDKDSEGNIVNSDTTNNKMGTVMDEGKSNAQELLNKLGDFTGFDFLKNAEFDKVKEALNSGGKSNPILNVLGHTGGYIAGRLTNVPGGGLVGSLIGGAAAHAADGGAIAKSLMDKYLALQSNPTAQVASAALQKYGPMLVKAAKQGGNQLAATYYVLSTSHPEFQKLVNDEQSQ